jgi:Regulator of G protein signaling domain
MGATSSITMPGILKLSSQNKPTDKGSSIQDDARSFRSKSGAIKMLIRGEDSRQAFRSYMIKTQPKGEVEYLDYYLAVEAIKKSGATKAGMHDAFLTIVKEYEVKAESSKQPVVMAIHETTHSWQGIETLGEAELLKHMTRSQDEVLSILTPNFEKFISSNVYLEYSKGQHDREKQSSGAGQPSGSGNIPVFIPAANNSDRPKPPKFTASSTVITPVAQQQSPAILS